MNFFIECSFALEDRSSAELDRQARVPRRHRREIVTARKQLGLGSPARHARPADGPAQHATDGLEGVRTRA